MPLSPANLFTSYSTGFSVTRSAIRAVSIDDQRQVHHSGEIGLDPQAFSGGKVYPELIKPSLESLLSQTKFASKYIAVTIPEYYSFTRTHTLPPMPIEDVSEALSWQLEQILPLPRESVYFDWKLIERSDQGLTVLVIATARETLEKLIEAFESVDLKPISFEPSASALTRVVSLPKSTHNILIEVNPYGSSATLVRNNISQLTVTNQFVSNTPEEVRSALQKSAESVQSLIQYCASRNPDLPDEVQLHLTGESASNEVAGWLQTLLNRPVELLNLSGVPIHYHQAFAAATVDMLSNDRSSEVNLLPDSLRTFYANSRVYQQVVNNFKWVGLSTLISLGLAGASFGLAMTRTRSSVMELNQIESSNARYSYDQQEIVAINQNSQAVVRLFPSKNNPVEMLNTFFSLLNPNIRLTSYTYERETRTLAFTGNAVDRASLLEFIDALKREPKFAQANLPVNALEKPTDINFSLQIVVTPD